MTKKTFTFINKYKNDWRRWWTDFSDERNKWVDSKKDFQITIEPYKKLRGEKALRGYWVLIGVVQKYMNEDCGNNWTKDEISDYFKLRAKHSKRINNVQVEKIADVNTFYEHIPRSIANNSGCTYEEMKGLIDYILRFGAENNIVGCELKSSDWQEFELYYGVKNEEVNNK